MFGIFKKKNKRQDDFYDDGRVIADMDVDGVQRGLLERPALHRDKDTYRQNPFKEKLTRLEGEAPWTTAEIMQLYFGSMGAALLVGVIFFAIFGLLIYLFTLAVA